MSNNANQKRTSDEKILLEARARRKKSQDDQSRSGALAGQKLVAPKRKGFHKHWVNDVDQKIDNALNKGYSFVSENKSGGALTTDIGNSVSQIVGSHPNGGSMRAYLMEIPEELYADNQKIKEHKVQVQANAVKGNERDAEKMATKEGRSEIYEP